MALWQLALLMSQIREHNEEWAMDPEKIVVSDFLAGGHLACSLSVFWDREFVYGSLRCDAKTIRPDGMILCYPVITSGSYCHAGSFEKLLGRKQATRDVQIPGARAGFGWRGSGLRIFE